MPGIASVGNPDAIAAPRVTPFHHAVVSLPHLLLQALNVAPWVERAIWIAGSLLAMVTAWRMAMHPALPSAAGGRFRQAGDALRRTFELVAATLYRTSYPISSTTLNSSRSALASESPLPPLPSTRKKEDTSFPNVPAGAGVGVTIATLPPLPRGAPPVNMSDRHILTNLNFWKGVRQNSYLIEALSESRLNALYREAFVIGPKQGEVTLSNGQTWFIEKATGKFYPVRGPGVINLTQQEVRFLEKHLVQQIRRGVPLGQALQYMSRAMGAQRYTVTDDMHIARSRLTTRLGYSADDLGRAIAPHLPASATIVMPADATAAAQAKAAGRPFRFVRWGGRILLVIGLAMDAYEVYYAENRLKTFTQKVGGWSASFLAGGVAAKAASPLLAGGPWGWLGYVLIVAGAGVAGYLTGETVTKAVYEWVFE